MAICNNCTWNGPHFKLADKVSKSGKVTAKNMLCPECGSDDLDPGSNIILREKSNRALQVELHGGSERIYYLGGAAMPFKSTSRVVEIMVTQQPHGIHLMLVTRSGVLNTGIYHIDHVGHYTVWWKPDEGDA